MSKSLRIVYAGTPDFSVPALKQLVDANYNVVAVYTQPDRPAGRGRELKPSPVKAAAQQLNIDVFQPESFKDKNDIETLRKLQPDLIVVTAYGLLLPKEVLDIPKYGCINIHASLLPRWRGAAPIQRSILAGDSETGITIMQMDEGLDTGDMILSESCEIGEDETASSLHDRLMVLGGETLLKAIPMIISGNLVAKKQNDEQVTYAKKLNKKEAEIDWNLSAAQLQKCVQAYNAWPVAFTQWQKNKNQFVVLRLWQAHALNNLDGAIDSEVGTVISSTRDGIDVVTGDGVLRITQLQAPGKQKCTAADFINAYQLEGKRLGQSELG